MRKKKWPITAMIALMLVPSGLRLDTPIANAAGGANENGPGDLVPRPPVTITSPVIQISLNCK